MTVFSNLHWHSPQKSFQCCKLSEKLYKHKQWLLLWKTLGLFLCKNERNSALPRTPLRSALGRGFPFFELQKTWISHRILKIACTLSVLRMNEWQIRGFDLNFRSDHSQTLTKSVRYGIYITHPISNAHRISRVSYISRTSAANSHIECLRKRQVCRPTVN